MSEPGAQWGVRSHTRLELRRERDEGFRFASDNWMLVHLGETLLYIKAHFSLPARTKLAMRKNAMGRERWVLAPFCRFTGSPGEQICNMRESRQWQWHEYHIVLRFWNGFGCRNWGRGMPVISCNRGQDRIWHVSPPSASISPVLCKRCPTGYRWMPSKQEHAQSVLHFNDHLQVFSPHLVHFFSHSF